MTRGQRSHRSLRVGALADRLRSSLFFVPMVFVVGGAALGMAMIEADARLGDGASDLPFVLRSTVDSAREVLSVVASATITVAGIAFSVSLLVLQQASSQYSPRVVHSLFRDPFNRRVMGLALGTFTYCLIVLRVVRGSLDDSGAPVVPNLSVGVAVVLGVVAILAIIAFIDHNAHTLEVSQILHRVTTDTVAGMDAVWAPVQGNRDDASADDEPPRSPGHTVVLARSGWIQHIDTERLLRLTTPGGTVRLDTAVGRYAVRGTPLCTIWPVPGETAGVEERADDALGVGPVRTMQQDPSYGIRQLADVALVALSPGVNDPTTAQDALFHLADVLRVALTHDLPPVAWRGDDGRRLIQAEPPTHEALVDLAFDEIRRAAAGLPAVSIYLLEVLHLLELSLRHDDDITGRTAAIRRQARLVVEGAERSGLLPDDLSLVRAASERRFGAATGHSEPGGPEG